MCRVSTAAFSSGSGALVRGVRTVASSFVVLSVSMFGVVWDTASSGCRAPSGASVSVLETARVLSGVRVSEVLDCG